jgi:Tol biopolymer transport system component
MARRHVLLLIAAVGLLAAFLPAAQAAHTENAGRIAFSSNRDDADYDIYAIDPDGGHLVRLTNSEGFDGYPSWSPDGDRIAFRSDRDGDPEIYLMDPDGNNVEQLTHNTARDTLPIWSEDGNSIVFVSDRAGSAQVFVMRADGTHQTQVTFSPDTEQNVWAAFLDGGKIIFTHQTEETSVLQTIHKDGKGLREFPTGTEFPGDPDVTHRGGPRITFNNNFCQTCDLSNIFTIKADGTGLQQLTDDFGNNLEAVWSPNGRAIAWTHEDLPAAFDHEDIWTMDADGSNKFNVTNNPADDFGASWGCPGKGDCKG